MGATMKGRLLVADDDEALQVMLAKIAQKNGFAVIRAYDGESALRAAREGKPDCILLDIMMPRMDGRDVLKRLKADPQTAHIPVVVFSARGEQSDRRLGLELGADDYVEKPFNVDMLVRKLEYLIWKKRSG